MQGEISRLYYEYYRFAFDTARKAERTMKQELMRPEVDAPGLRQVQLLGRRAQGLALGRGALSGRQADGDGVPREQQARARADQPRVAAPAQPARAAHAEGDRHVPGHHSRMALRPATAPATTCAASRTSRLSIPSVVGPYTSVNCTLSLLKSSLRKSPVPKTTNTRGRAARTTASSTISAQCSRSSPAAGNNDSGLFETNLRDERFLPFEGAGAEDLEVGSADGRLSRFRLRHDLRRHPAHPLHRAPRSGAYESESDAR